jgi:hypothetical protein
VFTFAQADAEVSLRTTCTSAATLVWHNQIPRVFLDPAGAP